MYFSKKFLFVTLASIAVLAIQVSGQIVCNQLTGIDRPTCEVNNAAAAASARGAPANSVQILRNGILTVLNLNKNATDSANRTVAYAKNQDPQTGAKNVTSALNNNEATQYASAGIGHNAAGSALAVAPDASQSGIESCIASIQTAAGILGQGTVSSRQVLSTDGSAAYIQSLNVISNYLYVALEGGYRSLEDAARICFSSLTAGKDISVDPTSNYDPRTQEAKDGITNVQLFGAYAIWLGADRNSVNFLVKNAVSGIKLVDAAGLKLNQTIDASSLGNQTAYINALNSLNADTMGSASKIYVGISVVGQTQNIKTSDYIRVTANGRADSFFSIQTALALVNADQNSDGGQLASALKTAGVGNGAVIITAFVKSVIALLLQLTR